jgi:chromosome partitioning protein
MHVAVALMNIGQRVATIDLDSRQKSFTHYVEHRRDWAERTNVNLKIPIHFCIARGDTLRLDENEAIEFAGFADALASVQESHDFVVVDTPGADSYLNRLAHSMADTLITPLNDSFVDLDVLGTVDPITYAVTGESHYAELVRDARRHRRTIDGTRLEWIVVRNRLSMLGSHNKQFVGQGLDELATRLGFRFIEGLSERVIYRELFPRGLTALDPPDESAPAARPNAAHQTAQQEVMRVIDALKLPLNIASQRRAAARAEWIAAQEMPLEVHDLIED